MNTNVSSVAQVVVFSASVEKLVSDFRGFVSKTAQGILEMARVVYEAKKLGKKEFKVFCDEIGYLVSSSTIRKLRFIGVKYAFLKNHKNALPLSCTVLYQICLLPEEVIELKIEEGVITPNLDRKGVAALLKSHRDQLVRAEFDSLPERDKKTIADLVNLSADPGFYYILSHKGRCQLNKYKGILMNR